MNIPIKQTIGRIPIKHTANKALNQIQKFPKPLQQIIHAIYETHNLSTVKLKQIIKKSEIREEDLMPWSDYEHPVTDSYGRKTIYDGGFFELMTKMSWVPGDFSALHDHGYTQWGIVKMFGPAEYATFWVGDDEISTFSRDLVKPGKMIGMQNKLVHQMGNSSTKPFLSLHIYGSNDRKEQITSDARIFDLHNYTIQQVDAGVFFGLPINTTEKLKDCQTPDFSTKLRHQVELIRRIQQMDKVSKNENCISLDVAKNDMLDIAHWDNLVCDLEKHIDENGHHNNSVFWKVLNWEVKEAAHLYNEIALIEDKDDAFQTYAEMYDDVVGKPCLNDFMGQYMRFFIEKYNIDFPNATLLSIGCGTGLIEQYMIKELEMNSENLYGIDLSAGMIKVAQTRINADMGNALELESVVAMRDLTFSGLNVFQYLDHQLFQKAIDQAAKVTKPGGYFFGDFITPDHIRWYPSIKPSVSGNVISLHTPKLIEKDYNMYQASTILHVMKKKGKMCFSHEGCHHRFLPSLGRVRELFEQSFEGGVDVYDAVTLHPIPDNSDTCPSTRYLVIAKK